MVQIFQEKKFRIHTKVNDELIIYVQFSRFNIDMDFDIKAQSG